MRKRICLILLYLMICVPFVVYAQSYSYDKAVQEGNAYINGSKYDTRNKYLILNNNQRYAMDNSGVLSFDSDFINGGFINYREFCLTTGNNSCAKNSYLVIPSSYWTMSGNATNRYYVNNVSGIEQKSDNNPSYVRVTEFVKPESTVSGTGSFSSPWYFDGNHYILIKSNSTKYGYFGLDKNNNKKGKLEKYAGTSCILGSGYCTNFDITLTHGYENNKEDGCNLNLISKEEIQANGERVHKYEISNITKDIECVAIFAKKVFSITFNCDTATGSIPSKTVKYDENLVIPTQVCTKTGYLQFGWKNGNNEIWNSGSTVKFHYDDDQIGISNKKLDLTANMIPNTYYVEYNGNTNTGGSTAKSTHTYDESKNLTANGFTKTGYTFKGWATSAGGGVTYADQASVKNLTTTPNATVTLFAVWEANKFTVSYNGNGSTGGSTASHTCTYDQACSLAANGFGRKGYTFAGWKLANSGNTLAAGASIKNVSTGDTVTYYAQWTQCAGGTFNAGTTGGCSQCDAGYYSGAGASACTKCPSDQWSNKGATGCFSKCNSVTYKQGSSCSASCGGGRYIRYAYSSYDANYRCSSKDDWNGGSCNTQGCCSSTYTSYGSWGGYGSCSASCGGGVQYRYRTNTNYSNYNGQNCGSWQESGSQSCNTQSCTCTVYCKGRNDCSIYRPTNWDAVYGVYSCNPSTGRTGTMEQCWVNFQKETYGPTACNGGEANRGWSWMCTSGQLVNCFNWGGLTASCHTRLTCGNVEGINLRVGDTYSCSCSS